MTGRPGERDRRLHVLEAPRFGIVGEPVELSFRVEETSASDGATGETVRVTISIDGQRVVETSAAIGTTSNATLSLERGGPNVIEIEVEEGPDELTLLNNRAVVVANGVRDRLRVLLVSGEPHPGERTWRNLLRSDPSVDLVHFTILRPQDKHDGTPVNELSLIAFPTHELFDEKLDQFDLIIFDRYKRRGVLSMAYFLNIVDFVEGGGAFLAADGPAFASPFSIARTPLAAILPALPTGDTSEGGFKPGITTKGARHPVTADLPGGGDGSEAPSWGRWFRTIDVVTEAGDTLMETPDGKPLMVLARAGEGRVAQILSDHIWLWSRGYEGGGPGGRKPHRKDAGGDADRAAPQHGGRGRTRARDAAFRRDKRDRDAGNCAGALRGRDGGKRARALPRATGRAFGRGGGRSAQPAGDCRYARNRRTSPAAHGRDGRRYLVDGR